ncbi:PaaI family thioesterase [Planctomycetota bacterium]
MACDIMKDETVDVENRSSLSVANGHCWCLLCGDQNPWSLKLAFREEGGKVVTRFQPNRLLQGYEGILHGGVISALLDASMTHCLFHQGIKAVTGELQVRFRHSVPYSGPVDLMAQILSFRAPLYYLEAELEYKGKTYASAKATFMKQ